MHPIGENWESVKQAILKEYQLTNISYMTWIEPLRFDSVKGDTVYIQIPAGQANMLSYITSKYRDYFKVTISEMMDHIYDVVFVVETPGKEEAHSDGNGPAARPLSHYHELSNLNPKYKFDTFVVGNNNKFAHSACLAVAESPGNAYNPLFIYGGAGLGKTHLMHSIGHFILDHNPDMKVLYVTSESFTNEVIESIRSGNATLMTKLREKYRTVDVLMIDDVQFIIGKESTQEEFFHTFNVLHSAGKQIVLSSDKPPKEMETLEERFRSRFDWGLIADIQPPDYETRMAILKRNAEYTHRHRRQDLRIHRDQHKIQYPGAGRRLQPHHREIQDRESVEDHAGAGGGRPEGYHQPGYAPADHAGSHPERGGGEFRRHAGRYPFAQEEFRIRLSQAGVHVSLPQAHGYLLCQYREDAREKRPHHHYPRCE